MRHPMYGQANNSKGRKAKMFYVKSLKAADHHHIVGHFRHDSNDV